MPFDRGIGPFFEGTGAEAGYRLRHRALFAAVDTNARCLQDSIRLGTDVVGQHRFGPQAGNGLRRLDACA